MPMMMSHILKSVDFTKTQKSSYLEKKNIVFPSNKKKFINYTPWSILLQKTVL